jgi:hypothetical protein
VRYVALPIGREEDLEQVIIAGEADVLYIIPLCLISDGMMWYVLLDSDTGGLASCGSTIGR